MLWTTGRAVFVWASAEPALVLIARNPAQKPRATAGVAATSGITLSPTPLAEVAAVPNHTPLRFVAPDLIQAKNSPRPEPAITTPEPRSHRGRRQEAPDLPPRGDWLPVDASPILISAEWWPHPAQERQSATTRTWSGSLWIAVRDGSGTALASGNGQLGGSQAGVRVYRTLTPGLALTGRLSTALAAKGAEASVGIALRHGAFAVLAERRFAIDSGGRNDWSLTAIAGVSDVKLPFGALLDGYTQAGVVGRDGFADGALRIERPVFIRGPSHLSLGAGVWGSIQPGVARLDVGPQIVAHSTVAGRPFRVSAEWRQRIAGTAAPGSGPVVTLGADF